MLFHVVEDNFHGSLEVVNVFLKAGDKFRWDDFLEIKEDGLFDDAAVLVHVQLLDIEGTVLVHSFVAKLALKLKEPRVGDFGVVRFCLG